MSASQLFPNQPAASSSNLGGSRPQIIFKFPQAVQPVSAIPLSNALPSVPPAAKKMRRMAFKCSSLLEYPSVPVSASTPSSLPSNVQSIYDDVYLANPSPEVLEQFHVLAKLPLVVAYHFVSSCGNFVIRDEEWAALMTGLCDYPYYCEHPEELGLVLEKLRAQEGKRKAGKEVICDPIDVNVKMEAPDTMDSMDLDYPEEVPPASAPIPAVPAPAPTKPAVIWKVNDRQSYCEVSGVKTWFFKPLIKPVSSNGSIPSRDEMIRTAIKCIVMQVAELLSGSSKTMIEQDLWALADGLVQGVFNDLEEQLEYQALSQKSDGLETKNLHLKEQVSSQDSQLQEKDEELTHLKSFVRHFKGDAQSTEVQQLRGAMEAWGGEIEELKKKLAASEEACRVAAEESKSRDEELTQLQQLFDIYEELQCLLNIGDLPLEPVTTSTVAPMDVWGGPSSESFPFETKSDSTPNSLSNFVPSLDTTSLPSTLVETHNTSPVVIFSSGHPNAYFVRTGEDPLTYSLVEKNEDELADPSLHMALTLQDIQEQMEIEHVEDLYAQELEEVFGIPFDI
ncbi:hypothetical protein GYMLUDRAFT_252255 [Collybiopsis luxurians FD-317 M1]|uniref:Uncharacterized protein n=1 Tax=Collybiopsis luxurians FD-317 M1 TaxID=944289 RepID=A0A0D0ALV3_9AGAR|nr:hypothetical protein GYMLUDRAFT_252255 [Collybiopsis luxurians FD-317 M1]